MGGIVHSPVRQRKPDVDPILVSPAIAAAMLGIDPATLDELVNGGHLHAVWLPTGVQRASRRFKVSDLHDAVAAWRRLATESQ